jgi:hypothetical protein
MWIMTNFGIIMPTALPKTSQAHRDGWELQVRARDRVALQKFRARHMSMFTTSGIEPTPEMDYEYRFYCSRDDFAAALDAMVADIDYEKFKPTVMRKGNGGRGLQNLYNSIWYVVARHYDSVIIGGKGPRR